MANTIVGISERLKACMRSKGVTGYRVAKDTGFPAVYVYRWINNEATPRIRNLAVLAEYFDVPLDQLIFGKEERNGLQEENGAG